MADQRSGRGAGGKLAGVLELAQTRPEADELDQADVEPEVEPTRKARTTGKARTAARAARRTGRTVYIPDDLWERVIVQSHRRRMTCSDYIAGILERNVPDHRRVGAELPESQAG
jgi:hypothetical protein